MSSSPGITVRPFVPAAVAASLAERLQAFPFVGDLTAAGRQMLLQSCQSLRFSGEQRLLDAGDRCSALLLVERGAIRVSKYSPGGREILLYRVEPGESCVLGTTCLLRDAAYPAAARAVTGTDALAIPSETFRRLHEQEPALRRFVMDLYAMRLEELMLLVEAVTFRRMDERLADLLLRHGRIDASTCRPVETTHEALAAELGTAREVISRLLTHFAEIGCLALERRKIRILDPAALQNIARPAPPG